MAGVDGMAQQVRHGDQTRTCYRNAETPKLYSSRPRPFPAGIQFRRSNSAASGLACLISHLLGDVGPALDLLLDPRVVQVELLGVGHAAHLELDAGAQRALLCPLLGLFL